MSTYDNAAGVEVTVRLPDGSSYHLSSLSTLGALYTHIAQTAPSTVELTVRSQQNDLPTTLQLDLQSSPLLLPKHLKVFYFDEKREGEAKTSIVDMRTSVCHTFVGDVAATGFQDQINICSDDLDAEIRIGKQMWILRSGSGYRNLEFTLKKRNAIKPGKCGNSNSDFSDDLDLDRIRRDLQSYSVGKRAHAPARSNDTTRYIELYVVVDHDLYLRSGLDDTKTLKRVLKILNYASKLYTQMNIYLAVVGVEIWTDQDKFSVKGPVSEVLGKFKDYRRFNINNHTHNDNAQLFVADGFTDGTVGQGALSVCSHTGSAAVTADHYEDDWIQAATTMAHELGHNLGLRHDDDIDPQRCMCPRTDGVDDNKCIMYSTSDSKLFVRQQKLKHLIHVRGSLV